MISRTSRQRCKRRLMMSASVHDAFITIVAELHAIVRRSYDLDTELFCFKCNKTAVLDKALAYACGMTSMYPRALNLLENRIAAQAPEPEANDAGCI
jgi:hypothetical protein